jgi:hypothetical protein
VLFSPLDATGASGAQGRAVRARLHHSLSAEAGR